MTLFKHRTPYERLAKFLNQMPNGFPLTEDGTHLRVLEWIFTPEEAEIFQKMKFIEESVKKIARRLKMPVDETAKKLEIMISKGQIRYSDTKNGRKYGLMPFVVGIYEEQIHRIDADFSNLMQEYLEKSQGDVIFSTSPAIHKVIPVRSTIKTDLTIHTKNEAEKLVMNAKSWGVRDCICRKQQHLIGNECKYPLSVCLMFSSNPNKDYNDSHDTRAITKEEALDVIKEAQEAGLIHSTANYSEGQSYICNCCTCCCGVIGALTKYDQPNAFVKSDFRLQIDEEFCTGCGTCLERCQFEALEIVDGICTVNQRCVGCGVCAMVCPEDAMHLVPREDKDIKKQPKNQNFWMIKRAIKRKVNLLKFL